MKKFYRTIIQVEVLSEDEIDLIANDLEAINYAITDGDCSGVVSVISTEVLSPQQMARATVAQGSDPTFFGIDQDGNPTYDW